jgi:hypothetical protein
MRSIKGFTFDAVDLQIHVDRHCSRLQLLRKTLFFTGGGIGELAERKSRDGRLPS